MNKMSLEEYKGVFVFAQQVDNVLDGVAFELLGKGKDLAKDLNTEVTAVLIGSGVKGLADQLAEYGADRVIVVDDPELKEYRTEPYTHALASVIEKYKPEIVLVGATAIGRDLGPTVSARVKTGLTADCTVLEIGDFPLNAIPGQEQKHNQLLMTRPAFGGNTIATIACPDNRPQMATVRPGVMQKIAPIAGAKAVIEEYNPGFTPNNKYVTIKEVVKAVSDTVDIKSKSLCTFFFLQVECAALSEVDRIAIVHFACFPEIVRGAVLGGRGDIDLILCGAAEETPFYSFGNVCIDFGGAANGCPIGQQRIVIACVQQNAAVLRGEVICRNAVLLGFRIDIDAGLIAEYGFLGIFLYTVAVISENAGVIADTIECPVAELLVHANHCMCAAFGRGNACHKIGAFFLAACCTVQKRVSVFVLCHHSRKNNIGVFDNLVHLQGIVVGDQCFHIWCHFYIVQRFCTFLNVTGSQ